MSSAGVMVSLAALILAGATLYATFGPLRRRLDDCLRDRADLRRRLDVVTRALLAQLSGSTRAELARELSDPVDEAA